MTNQRTPGELLRAYYAALDSGRLDELDGLFADDLTWSFPGATLHSATEVKQSMARSLATGLHMQHAIGHLVERDNVAICELVATNRLLHATYTVAGAVVCEAAAGRITRLAAYPEARAMTEFLRGMRAQG